MSVRPRIELIEEPTALRAVFDGSWIARRARWAEQAVAELESESRAVRHVIFDLSRLDRLDTAGAWLIERTRRGIADAGVRAEIVEAIPTHLQLIEEVKGHKGTQAPPRRPERFVDMLSDVGEGVVGAGRDLSTGTAFLGQFVATLGRIIVQPWRLRLTSLVHHLELIGLRSVPIITLISFLVGCIVAQQGIFQLEKFGATIYVVDLVGILTLRELALLLTAIMIAGRSGSAITAEIGSMKMREEIDALRVMGLDPMEVLIVPRVLALVIALPLLTFLASMAGLFGAGLVAHFYGGISTDIFLLRLRNAIAFNTFMVGLIKAPFMALVIGLIASIEGLAVKGSAESLGRQTTSSVVKAIFMVIVVDGLFAMFFASIDY
jgi:phospholipid/cholesterol/gamma-HCH transport system permease protein